MRLGRKVLPLRARLAVHEQLALFLALLVGQVPLCVLAVVFGLWFSRLRDHEMHIRPGSDYGLSYQVIQTWLSLQGVLNGFIRTRPQR